MYVHCIHSTYVGESNENFKTSCLVIVICWTQKVHNDFTFLGSIILPPVGHSSKHEYHRWNLQSRCGSNFYRNFKVFSWLSLVYILQVRTSTSGIVIHATWWGCQSPNHRNYNVLNGNFLLNLRGPIKERNPGGKRDLPVLIKRC